MGLKVEGTYCPLNIMDRANDKLLFHNEVIRNEIGKGNNPTRGIYKQLSPRPSSGLPLFRGKTEKNSQNHTRYQRYKPENESAFDGNRG